MGVRFAVLGPVEITADGRPLPAVAPRHRAVLAYLLLNAPTVISADQLADAMWGLTPPDTARAQIQATIAVIRRVLRQAGAAELLQTRSAGYVIAAERLDLSEFTAEVAAAQKVDDKQEAARRIRAALGLWRGQALADVHADYVESARARLEERRLAAVERLTDLELDLGHHAELVDELFAQVAAHPLREKLNGQLMLALHRSGRQTDALAVARTFRATLAEEQGLDPSRAFTALEEGILRDDPVMDAPPAARSANHLPYDTPDFTGRSGELAGIAPAGDGVTLWTVDGMAGSGKTTLAVHAAHRLAARYPDAQLFVDLRAHTAGQSPLDPGGALETLLRQLGVPADRLPPTTEERAALWRAELAGRRVLVVLDNAADADQVRPLLPGASTALVLVTSRRRLTGLDGAHALSVDVLPDGDARALFGDIVGERAAAEPEAVLEVLRLCGFLPLAVRIAAARLQHRPRWTVAYLADRLRDHRRRLSELSTSDKGVAAAFALSYEHLEPAQRRMFRLLGLHPGPDVDAEAAAALADLSQDQAEDLLEGLLDTHVMLQHEPGRYTFHDLLREHARETAAAEEDEGEREQALARLFGHYLRGVTARGESWQEAERANLIAVAVHATDHELPGDTGHDVTALHRHLYDRAHADALALYAGALEAARTRGDRSAEARTLIDLGWVRWRHADYDHSAEEFERALELSGQIGERYGQARALQGLGHVRLRRGDEQAGGREHEDAHADFVRALDLYRELGDRIGTAGALVGLGLAAERLDRPDEAAARHAQALELYRELDDRGGIGDALDGLAAVQRRRGHHDEALGHHRRALSLHREIGYRTGEAVVLNGLAETLRAAGDPDGAAEQHRAALALARELDLRPEQARALRGLR
ncbi:AfsR/SARP family transcriptional regulator [Nonomuraea sediminis]|uniref:AfsR/SARP family transcriptional regulator n=1 Tax=Nonomuraea sediminis TaxID=2835864 RepID=UPI001BDD78A3|nr:AfsR/SARP family transcriptional regulator [Nonomuraea sediminis]